MIVTQGPQRLKGHVATLQLPLVVLLEQHGGQTSNDLAMKMGIAFGGQAQNAVKAHMATFEVCKPRQEGGTLRTGGD